MLTLLKKKLNLYILENIIKNNKNLNYKHYSPANLEWFNSVYNYNLEQKLLPISDKIVINLIKNYINLKFKTILNSSRPGPRLKGLTTNKIFLSNSSIKHTSNKIIITLYIYNREFFYLIKKLETLHNILKTKYKSYYDSNYYLYNFKSENLIFNKNVTSKLFNSINLENSIVNYENFYNKILKMELLYVYYYKNLLKNNFKFKDFNLFYLKNLITKVYNKKVEFNIIHLKQLYLNSDMFIESIAIKLKNRKNKLLKVFKKALKMVKLPVYLKKSLSKTTLFNVNIYSKHININNIFNLIKYKSISGIRIEASGRLTKRLTASRSIFKSKHKGSIKNIDSSFKGLPCIVLRGNNQPNIQFSKINSKTRNGSFGLKGWLSSS